MIEGAFDHASRGEPTIVSVGGPKPGPLPAAAEARPWTPRRPRRGLGDVPSVHRGGDGAVVAVPRLDQHGPRRDHEVLLVPIAAQLEHARPRWRGDERGGRVEKVGLEVHDDQRRGDGHDHGQGVAERFGDVWGTPLFEAVGYDEEQDREGVEHPALDERVRDFVDAQRPQLRPQADPAVFSRQHTRSIKMRVKGRLEEIRTY